MKTFNVRKISVMRKASTDSWLPRLGMIALGMVIAGGIAVGTYFVVNNGKTQMVSGGQNLYTGMSSSSTLQSAGGTDGNATVTNGQIGASSSGN